MRRQSQGVLDALADAETLRWSMPRVIEWHPLYSDTYVSAPMRSILYRPFEAYRRAVNAAHAAFRACPGLRG